MIDVSSPPEYAKTMVRGIAAPEKDYSVDCIIKHNRLAASTSIYGYLFMGPAGQFREPDGHVLPSLGGTANHENCVFPGDGADYLLPCRGVDRLRDRLRPRCQSVENDELADAIDTRKQLG